MQLPADIGFPAKVEFLPKFLAFVRSCLRSQGFDGERVSEIVLVAEEALANVFLYAYPDELGDVQLRASGEEGHLVLEITDTGIPLDPLSREMPDLDAGIEDRQEGGLGVFLIRQLADDVSYRREGDQNILRLTVRKERP